VRGVSGGEVVGNTPAAGEIVAERGALAIVAGTQLDRYRLLEPVGEGSQGSVWKAVDPSRPNEPVALKLAPIPPGGASGPELERIRREAGALGRLNHPSLVRCHGLFEDYRNEVLGVVLEWVDGQSLTTAARDRQMTPAHKMWLLGHLVRALAYVHGAGVVHRDIKFGNVVVSHGFWAQPQRPEMVKLVDLGVAVAVGNPNPLTAMGKIVGTAAYVPPEVLTKGKNPRANASPRGDVFAFGVLGWRLLTGEHPSGVSANGEFVQFIAAYQGAMAGLLAWPAAGDVDGPWGDVLCACMSLDPAQRPESGVQIVSMLDGNTPVPPRAAQQAAGEPEDDEDEVPTTFKPSPLLAMRDAARAGAGGSWGARGPASQPQAPRVEAPGPGRPSGGVPPTPQSPFTPQGRPPETSPLAGTMGPARDGIVIPGQAGPVSVAGSGGYAQPSLSTTGVPATLPQGQAPPPARRGSSSVLIGVCVIAGLVMLTGLGILLGLYLRSR
jgi:eukaryotic-like serine/threonine-protein kinase